MVFDFRDCNLNEFVNGRLNANRDSKIIITARNSETGTGKTTLAVNLALLWDRNGWTADKGFLDIKKYLAYYAHHGKAGDVLLLDDAEAGADNRRSTSKFNVLISKYWSIFRAKNIVSMLTLPTVTMLDKRLMELADWLLIVRERGIARPYRIYIDDIKHNLRTIRSRNYDIPGIELKEEILFGKYEGEPYQNMKWKKDHFVNQEIEEDFDESVEEILTY